MLRIQLHIKIMIEMHPNQPHTYVGPILALDECQVLRVSLHNEFDVERKVTEDKWNIM